MWFSRIGALVAALAAPVAAQTLVHQKISGPMVSAPVGDAFLPVISPDGAAVLYALSRGEDVVAGGADPGQLAVAPMDGSGDPVLLTPLDGTRVRWIRWTPDGMRAVYVVEELATSSSEQLYAVPVDGSAPRIALSPVVSFGTSDLDENVQLTGDGSHVVYRPIGADLFSAPVDGSAPPVLLNGAMVPGGVVQGFRVSPTGSRVVYVADEEVDGVTELYSAPADGSAARIKISHALAAEEDVQPDIAIDASGTLAVYCSGALARSDIYSVPVDGSALPTRLNPPLSQNVWSFRVTPDGTAVVYRAAHAGIGQWELFLVPIDGSASATLLTPGWRVELGFEISPDSAHVVYEANTGGGTFPRLFGVRISDGAIAALHTSSVRSFQFTPDSSRVVFAAHPVGTSIRELYSAPIDGSSATVRINPNFVGAGGLNTNVGSDPYAITADSLQVVYAADAETLAVEELYRVPVVPSGPAVATKLNPPLVLEGDVFTLRLAPDASAVVFVGDVHGNDVFELVRSALAGPPAPIELSNPLPTGTVGDAREIAVRNGRVVYTADQDVNDRYELFGAPSDGSALPVKLSGTMVAAGSVIWWSPPALSPDGSRVVYLADAEADGRVDVFAAPSDGSSAPVKLNEPVSADRKIDTFRISPDGTVVAYVTERWSAPLDLRLYTAPIGGGASVALGPLTNTQFQFTPDSTRLVFPQSDHVYSVPVDGSAEAIDLSVGASRTGAFLVTADSARVVFSAQFGPSSHVFVNSIVGGALIDLSAALVPLGEAVDFALSVDGERVVYRADAAVDERFSLYSVPIDGSANPIELNGPLVAGGDVVSFQVSPDGENVVYVADEESDSSEHLHRVPVDGSEPAVQLSTLDLDTSGFELTANGLYAVTNVDGLRAQPVAGGPANVLAASADDFLITQSGLFVVYSAAGQLFVVSIGGGPVLPISPEPAGAVQSFALDGPRAVYLADQDELDVKEVYVSFPGSGPGPHLPPATQHAPPSGTRAVER